MIAEIELVPGGCFAARPSTVGTDDEEIAAAARGELPEARRVVIAENLRRAAATLHGAEPAGAC